MMSRRLASLVFVCLAAIALPSSVRGENRANEITTKVPFEFSAGDTPLPAGYYKLLLRRNGGASELQIRNEKGDVVATLAPVTRLARQHVGDAPTGSLVFDHSGGHHALAEAWFPGQDGFLLRLDAQEHEHAVVEIK
jgi:hypothetical protein